MNYNFTFSKEWINSFVLRYSPNDIKKYDNVFFYQKGNLLKCQHFFNFTLSEKSFDCIMKEIKKGNTLRFNYIDDSPLPKQLFDFSLKNDFTINIIDSWEAPRLVLNSSLEDYLKFNKNKQVKKNYKKYLKKEKNFIYKQSNEFNILDLWNDVLNIDYNSWKEKENSDMKSLDREDLQYLLFLLKNPQSSNLNVIYYNEIPLAYSLMFKDNTNDFWYAVKWGASFEGRNHYAGIFCLFNHLESIFQNEGKLNIDFWGRRNNTYDQLKNNYIVRKHIEITKKV